jgi:nicotinate-nucleotide adenylyltransferase
MRLAILGGSFNPIHLGHLFLADVVLSELHYDRIVLVPAFESPFKIGFQAASPKDRLDMALASIAADPRLTVDECEIKREGVSYTIDTISYIKDRYRPEGKPGLIIGDDLVSSFSRWKMADKITEGADIIVARRVLPQALQHPPGAGFPYPHTGVNNEIMNVSSHLVREKILSKGPWRSLVPLGARLIIEERRLYGYEGPPPPAGPGGRLSPPEKPGAEEAVREGPELTAAIENAARLALKPSRFLHSRNTALLARDLALAYGLSPQTAYLAGIAHDFCRSMDSGELIRLARKDGKVRNGLEKEKPSLLHGRAAAVLLEERFGVKNPEVIEAVACHVMGSRDMGELAKIVYIADKIEVSREWVNPELREKCGRVSLDELFASVLADTVAYFHSRRMTVSPGTLRLLSAMDKGKMHEKKKKS